LEGLLYEKEIARYAGQVQHKEYQRIHQKEFVDGIARFVRVSWYQHICLFGIGFIWSRQQLDHGDHSCAIHSHKHTCPRYRLVDINRNANSKEVRSKKLEAKNEKQEVQILFMRFRK
jgi:hypothetical protein